jgi:hypothetical protein
LQGYGGGEAINEGEAVGLFGKSKKQARVMQEVELRRGTQVAIVDLTPAFIAWARETFPREPKIGHVVPVQVALQGNDIVVIRDGARVGRMDPNMVDLYAEEFKKLAYFNVIGTTFANIKWDGSKSPHTLQLNYGTRAAFDGGIIPPLKVTL